MGVQTQTRFDTTLNGAITDVQTTAVLDASPARTTGFGTFERGGASEEDVFWGNVAGLQLTNMLRGLSQTALTVTEVVGNQKAHVDGVSFEGTLLHYIVNNKADVDDDETITGDWDFIIPPEFGADPTGANDGARKSWIDTQLALKANLAGGNTFSGVQIFADDGAETTTNAAPTSDKKLANKKYVDDQVAAVADFPQPLATAISDVTATAAEINVPLDGVSGNVTAANLNTQTAGATSNAGALHNHSNLIYTYTAGEAIDGSTTPKAAFVSKGTTSADAFPLQVQETENNADSDVYGVNFRCQTFTTTTFQTKVTRVDLLLIDVSDCPGNFQIDIYAVDVNHKPTGASLATQTITANTVAGGFMDWTEMTLSSALTVTGSTEYAIVARAISGDASNYIGWQSGSGNTYSGGQAFNSSDAGGTWSSNGSDFAFRVWGYEEQTAGSVYMSDSNEPFRGAVDGFVVTNSAQGASCTLAKPARLSGFVGLTTGAPYFVSSTLGGIGTSGGLKVGVAASATELDVDLAGGYVLIAPADSPQLLQATTAVEEYLAIANCGFKPSRVELFINLTTSTSTPADDRRTFFSGIYTSALYGVAHAGGGSGANPSVSFINGASSLTAAAAGASGIVATANDFRLTNTGLVFDISMNDIASSTNATGSFSAICYR